MNESPSSSAVPAAPPPDELVPAEAAGPPPIEYGGFWVRFAAYVIDGLLLSLIGILIAVPFGIVYGLTAESGAMDPAAQNLLSAISLAVSVGYFTWSWVRSGSTPGMSVLGLKVVRDADGGPIGWGTAVVRYLGIIVSSLALGIGLIWVAFDERKRGWHDMLAGTVVVRRPDVPITGGRRAVMIGAIGCGCVLPILAVLAIVALLAMGTIVQDTFNDVGNDLARGPDGRVEEAVELPYSALRVGDCFDLLDPDTPTIATVRAEPCVDEHVYEVFFIEDMPDGDYPGDAAVSAFVEENCIPAFEAYVGVPFEESTWFASPVGPAEADWQAGTRRVTCQLHTQAETPVTGSARDSRE